MTLLSRIALVAATLLALLLAAPEEAFSGGGLVELVLPNQQPVSDTNPLPIKGTVAVSGFTAASGTQKVQQLGVVYTQAPDTSVGTSSTALAPADTTRTYLLIQNKGPQALYLNYDAPAVNGSGVLIGAGGNYEAIKAATNAVFGIAPTGSTTITVIRGN